MFKKRGGSAARKQLRKPTAIEDAGGRVARGSDSSDDDDSAIVQPTKRSKLESVADPSMADIAKLVASSKANRIAKGERESLRVVYESSGADKPASKDQGATRTIDIDGRDEKKSKQAIKKKKDLIGPQRSSANIRVTCRFDYQPDICKDYKQTGYCGYGDSCKFLHDRGDYKAGWELDREWEQEQKRLREEERINALGPDEDFEGEGLVQEEEFDADDELPFACHICREGFTNPVVTKCGHYFCEKCAIDRYRSKHPKCAVCGETTQGIFKPAKDLQARLEKRQERLRQKEEQARLQQEQDEEESISQDDQESYTQQDEESYTRHDEEESYTQYEEEDSHSN